jgi:PAP2 superfamily protein
MTRIIFPGALIFLLWVQPIRANADAVVDWNRLAAATQEADYNAHPEARLPSTWSPKLEAIPIVALAVFQAVNTATPRYTPFRATLPASREAASGPAAAAAAGHAALVKIFPERKEALDDAYALSLALIPDSPARTAGMDLGERAAAQLIAWRTADNAATAPPYRPYAIPGKWVASTPMTIAPWRWSAKPWLLASNAQFRPKAPPSLASTTWARDFNETRTWGAKDSAVRSPEWTALAKFYMQWRLEPLVEQVALGAGRTLEQNARLYALASMVVVDAGFAEAEAKLHYSFWRPITAIRNGDQSGNESTQRDAAWEPLLSNPVQPEYPCGHCNMIAALTTVLSAEGPPPSGGIEITSDAFPGVVHTVASYAALVEQISMSRIYAGAHFRSSVEAGVDLGRNVANFGLQGFLKPLD